MEQQHWHSGCATVLFCWTTTCFPIAPVVDFHQLLGSMRVANGSAHDDLNDFLLMLLFGVF
jgi:hypothetical protein